VISVEPASLAVRFIRLTPSGRFTGEGFSVASKYSRQSRPKSRNSWSDAKQVRGMMCPWVFWLSKKMWLPVWMTSEKCTQVQISCTVAVLVDLSIVTPVEEIVYFQGLSLNMARTFWK
jgi:hypothetical protein